MTDHEITMRNSSEKDKELLDAVVERFLERSLPILIDNFEPFELNEKDVLESIGRLAKGRYNQL